MRRAVHRCRRSSCRRRGRVKRGRAVRRCRRSACRSRRCVGLCIAVIAVLAAAADAVLVAHQVHPATIERNPIA
jgi:hypothetical protein